MTFAPDATHFICGGMLHHYDDGHVQRCDCGMTQTYILLALIEQWRREGAFIDGFHATMGTGYTVCADGLEAVLKEKSDVH